VAYRPNIPTDALTLLTMAYSMTRGIPYVAQYGPARGGLSHLLVAVIAAHIGQAAHDVAKEVFAPNGGRLGTYVALGLGATGLCLGYYGGMHATNYLNRYYDNNAPRLIKKVEHLFSAVDSLPYRVDYKAPLHAIGARVAAG